MPTKLGEPYSPLWRGKYPHMLPEDVPVWNQFLNKHQGEFQRIFYDVKIGGIMLQDQTVSDKMKQMYFDVTAKRIDALAELDQEIWIIEVTTKASFRHLGQLLTYLPLYFDDPAINKKAIAVLVCQQIDADLQRGLDFYGMRARLVD